MAVNFSVQFRINEKTQSRVLRLTDTSTGFTFGKGNFSVTFSDGSTRIKTDFSTPDISASGGYVDITLVTDSTGAVITGSYKVDYVALDTSLAGYSLSRTFDFNWVKPTKNIVDGSDVLLPEVKFYDNTSYTPSGSFTGVLTRTFTTVMPSNTPQSGTTVTGVDNLINPVFSGNYYEGIYTAAADVSVAYTHTTNSWLTVLYIDLLQQVIDVQRAPTQAQLIGYINTYHAAIEAYETTNDTQFDILNEEYDLVMALYSHLIARYESAALDGSEPILAQLLDILLPYRTHTYTSAPLTTFSLLTKSFNISDGTNTDAVPLNTTLNVLGSNGVETAVTDNTVTISPTYGTTGGTIAQGNDARFHDAVTIGTANGLSLSTQVISLSSATTSASGAMSAADKTKLDGIAAGAQTGTVTSVGVSMPAAFTVSNSPVTTSGTIAITATGTTLQYMRGDGTVATLNTTVVTEGDNLYYTQGRFDTAFTAKSTTDLAEGTNLYFTNLRARQAVSLTTTGVSGAATYNSTTGVLNIPIYEGGVTSFNTRTGAITLTSTDVTDALGFTPYNSTNPAGYTTNVGTVTSVGGIGTVSGLTLTGTVTTSGDLTLGGTLSLTSGNITSGLGFTPEDAANKGVAGGYASLDGSGLVPSTQLPSYVDDVLEYADLASFPATGVTGKIYVALDNNKIYRWSGSAYIEVSPTVGTIWGGITGTLTNQTDLQSALDAKQDDITLTTTGTSGAATFIGNTLNIPQYEGGVTSFNTRTGAITLTSSDVTTALTFTPYNATNPSAFIALTALSAGTGISYDNTTGVISNTITQYTDALARAAISLTTTGTSGAATYNSSTGVLNIPEYQGGVTSFNTRTGAVTLSSGDVTDALTFTPYNATNPSSYISLTALSSTATGLTYTNTTGVFSFTSGYAIPTTSKQGNWDDAYTFVAAFPSQTGNTGKYLTTDGSTLSWAASAAAGVTSFNTRTGDITLTSSDVTTALTYTPYPTPTGTTSQYVTGDGTLATFPSSTGYVPYTGATSNLNLGEYSVSAGQVQFDTSPTGSGGVGILRWNSDDGTLDLGLKGGNVTLQVGQETVYEVRNETGSTVPNGTSVYANGVTTGSGRITVAPFVADGTIREVRYLGLATEDISNGVNGFVTYFGYVRGLDTRGTSSSSISVGDETWAVGDILYAHPTVAGKLTNVRPQHDISIGIIIVRHQSSGVLFVRPSSFGHLDDSHDVSITSVANNEGLFYESATGLWKNKTIATILGYTPYDAANPSNYIALTALSSTATGLTYTNTTGVFSLTSGYVIPTTSSATDWDTAYTNRITSLTTTGSSGAATLTSNTLNIPTYTLAGLGGVPTSRTITINGTAFDLSADRSYTVSGGTVLDGTGFVKASGTTISYDNSTYYLASNPSGYITSSSSITGTSSNITSYTINQNLGTGNAPTFADVYTNGWLRNNNANTGLYSQAHSQHWYSDGQGWWNSAAAGGVSSGGIRFRDAHNSTVRGYVYYNTSNEIGFLNSGGSWSLRCDNSGNVTATGDVTAYSDARVKKDIHTITDALTKVNKLRGVSYKRTDSEDTRTKIGVIAQETMDVVPEVVNQDNDGTYSVSYGNMAGLFIEAFKEQQAQIASQGAQITELLEIVKTLKGV